MRKRNVDITCVQFYHEDSEAESVLIKFDTCWLYAFDLRSLDFFVYLVNLVTPAKPICFPFDGFIVKFLIPLNGKPIIEVFNGSDLLDSFPMVATINEYIREYEYEKYEDMSDLFKFISFFMPKYLYSQIDYVKFLPSD